MNSSEFIKHIADIFKDYQLFDRHAVRRLDLEAGDLMDKMRLVAAILNGYEKLPEHMKAKVLALGLKN